MKPSYSDFGKILFNVSLKEIVFANKEWSKIWEMVGSWKEFCRTKSTYWPNVYNVSATSTVYYSLCAYEFYIKDISIAFTKPEVFN